MKEPSAKERITLEHMMRVLFPKAKLGDYVVAVCSDKEDLTRVNVHDKKRMIATLKGIISRLEGTPKLPGGELKKGY